ncbi:unnamed protein product [Ambrosiozyma monospora]|uniref:Unnamed protein product n=1 Tax=Ambrosiozyma monospora TaxID=43982 RepID=A0ACB5T6N8_AMBMO|nr:unnamed protein product [Ambrosiozyma monospora]
MFVIKTSSRSASYLFKPTTVTKLKPVHNHKNSSISIRFSSSASASATSASASSSTTDSNTNDENLDTPQSKHTSKCTKSAPNSSSSSSLTSTSNKFKSLSSTNPTTTTHSTFGSAGTTSALACLPRVPSTSNIEEKQLMLDMLFNGSGPLTMPVKENHTVCPAKTMLSMSHPRSKRHHSSNSSHTSQSRSTTETNTLKPRPRNIRSKGYGASNSSTVTSLHSNMEKYKQIKSQNKLTNYNVYFNKQKKFTPINTVFTNSILNTQQHNLELFNLPLKLVENLKPFENCNLPGDEMFRDEMFYIRKWEVEEKLQVSKKQKKLWFDERLKMAKDGNLQKGEELFDGEIDFNEFFGFK